MDIIPSVFNTVSCEKCNILTTLLIGEPIYCKTCFEKWLSETFQAKEIK